MSNGGNYWCEGSELKLHYEFATPLVTSNTVKDLSFTGNGGSLPSGDYSITNGSGLQLDESSDKGSLTFSDATPACTIEVWMYCHSSDDNVEFFKLKSDGDLKLKYYANGDLKIKVNAENGYSNIFPTGCKTYS